MSETGFVLFCHGARDPRWREPFDLILRDFQQAMPDADVRLAFLELMDPSLPEVIDAMALKGLVRIQVIPLFLAPGGHTRRDLPALLQGARERWPALDLACTSTLTESAPVRHAIVRWATQVAGSG